jgi:hypothetical protein
MSRPGEPSRAVRGSQLIVPWLAYLAVTVAAPALNGAWRRPDFASHALLTFVASGALLGLWSLGRHMRPRARMDRRRARG